MPNFTSDYLFDSRKQNATHRSFDGRRNATRGPKRATINRLISYSKALEASRSDNLNMEIVLN